MCGPPNVGVATCTPSMLPSANDPSCSGLGKRYLKSIFSPKLPSLPAEGRREVSHLIYFLKVSSPTLLLLSKRRDSTPSSKNTQAFPKKYVLKSKCLRLTNYKYYTFIHPVLTQCNKTDSRIYNLLQLLHMYIFTPPRHS